MNINYSDLDEGTQSVGIIKALNAFAVKLWEKGKLDSKMWSVIKGAAITGDSYLYAFNEEGQGSIKDAAALKHQIINNINIYFEDEQNPNINEQGYIIIDERISVKKARDIARKNGVSEEAIALIVSDEDTNTQVCERASEEVKGNGKCMSILYMELVPEGLKFLRSTKNVVYEPECIIPGLDIYPIVSMRWEELIGSARGASGVAQMIPNQREVNACAARRAVVVKRFAFPTMVYDADRIENSEKLIEAGATISVKNLGQNPINTLISYLNPAPISSDAQSLQNEFIEQTRNLEGAGDAATGQVDPTKASGEAIRASRDQAAVPLNEQIAGYKQLIEDLALVWYKLWVVYSPNGIEVKVDEGEVVRVSAEELKALEVSIKVDVSPIDPYSKLSQEVALENLFSGGAISFEEYVEALDDASTVPKSKLKKIIEARQQESELQRAENTQLMQAEEAINVLAGEKGLSLPTNENAEAMVNEM
ncbi:MAG: hypothetical protein RR424_08890 [Oscillospiraceae bacterium]